jgi:hypothetical protein
LIRSLALRDFFRTVGLLRARLQRVELGKHGGDERHCVAGPAEDLGVADDVGLRTRTLLLGTTMVAPVSRRSESSNSKQHASSS